MAFCYQCGQRLIENSRFCTGCGAENTWYKQDTRIEIQSCDVCNERVTNKKVMPRKNVWIMIAIIIAVIAVWAIIMALIPDRVSMKYEWGTKCSEIEENEIVLWSNDGYPGGEKRLCCEDPDFRYECTKELRDGNRIFYWIDGGDRLCRMYYSLNTEISLSERLEILTKQYGDEYYIDECGYDD